MDISEARYISPPDTAKLIRKALRNRFPGRKFSVQTSQYTGGSSIHVAFDSHGTEDTENIRAVCRSFQGMGFDGTNDLAFPLYHWLTEGPTACLAYTPGSGALFGSRTGVVPDESAKLVRFGADYVFVHPR